MKKIIYLTGFIVISLIACSSTTKKETANAGTEKITISRFDKEIYDYLQTPGEEKESELKEKYPLFLQAYGQVAMITNDNDFSGFFANLREKFSHPLLIQIYRDALNTYEDVSAYENELSAANALISEHLAGRKLPQLAMHVAGFRQNVIVLDNIISISTDKYLGSEYAPYKKFYEPHERYQMQPKFVVRDYLRAWLMSEIVKDGVEPEENTLLSEMVDEGKILYALSVLLPDAARNDLIGYTADQMAWCENNEKNIWKTIVKQNYLFSKDNMVITRFINDAPNTTLVPQSSPGRLGSWVGLQIVEKYAKRKGIPLQEVINTDAQTILKEGKYNP